MSTYDRPADAYAARERKWILEYFQEELHHWGGPLYGEEHDHLSDDEFHQVYKDYFDKVSNDEDFFEEEWGELVEFFVSDFVQQFKQSMTLEEAKKILLDQLEEYLDADI